MGRSMCAAAKHEVMRRTSSMYFAWIAVSVMPDTDFCASSATLGQRATLGAYVVADAPNRLSSSSSWTSSSSRAAMRFFSVSYIWVGSTGCSGAFFFPFCAGGWATWAGAPLVGRVPGWVCAVFGGTGGAAAGAGGVGPAGAGLPCLAVCVPFMEWWWWPWLARWQRLILSLAGMQEVKRVRRRMVERAQPRRVEHWQSGRVCN